MNDFSTLKIENALALIIKSAQAAANATGQPQQVFLLDGFYNFAGAVFFDKNKVDEIPVCIVNPAAGHDAPGLCRLNQRRRLMGGFQIILKYGKPKL